MCILERERESEEGKGSLMKVGKLIKRTAEMLSSEDKFLILRCEISFIKKCL